MVVSRVYAATWCDQNPIAIDEDHSAIVKPENTQADIYVWARGRIRDTSGQAFRGNRNHNRELHHCVPLLLPFRQI